MRLVRRGFTLIELLVVVAVIAVLLGILIPTLRKAKEHGRRLVCSSGIKQQSLALLMYAQDNDETMPTMTWSGGQWLWDVSYFTTDVVMESGASRKIFRCPGNPVDTNRTRYWRYSEHFSGPVDENSPEPSSESARRQHWRVVSYAYLLETRNGRGVIWADSEPGQPKVPSDTKKFIDKPTQIRAPRSEMELIVDSVIEYGGYYKWNIPDKYANWAMGTNHMRRGEPGEPAGGNVGFLDGHVSWRHFDQMHQRYGIQGVKFWW